jgi:hypothetical protein
MGTIGATVLTLLYTTSSNALGVRSTAEIIPSSNNATVLPLLRLPPSTHMILAGDVRTDFANIIQYGDTCMDTWPDLNDEITGKSSCTQIKFVSLCYHNYARYMAAWKNDVVGSDWLNRRPITATLEDNITITTAWMDRQDVHAQSQQAGRISKQSPIPGTSCAYWS